MSVEEAVQQLGLRDSAARRLLQEAGAITSVQVWDPDSRQMREVPGVWGRDLMRVTGAAAEFQDADESFGPEPGLAELAELKAGLKRRKARAGN